MELLKQLLATQLAEASDIQEMDDEDLMDLAAELERNDGDKDRLRAVKAELHARGFSENGEGTGEDLSDLDFSELLDKYMHVKQLYRTEGRTGLTNLARLCRALGYFDRSYYGQLSADASIGDIISFLEDNSGAIDAVIEFIRSTNSSEWEENLRDSLQK